MSPKAIAASRVVLFTAACCALLSGAGAAASDEALGTPTVVVTEDRGIYAVQARFPVAAPPRAVMAVLTDFEQIPRYMPNVRRSVVHSRGADRLLVEQEAVSRVMMFSKKVHLLLEVLKDGNTLQFRDTCGRSFARYRGRWHLVPKDEATSVAYELEAQPSFDVPQFIVKHLLRRDAADMISHLQREIAARTVR